MEKKKTGPKTPEPIDTNELCHYGCGNKAKYKNQSGRLMCEKSSSRCESIKTKNSEGLKTAHEKVRKNHPQGKAGFFDYDSLDQKSKDRMNHNKGKKISSYEPIAKTHRERKKSIDEGRFKPKIQGFAADPNLRWKRNKIPYIDSKENWCVLESIHEWQTANLLDKNGIKWIRPKSYKLSTGKCYEPDFYLIDYDIYLDPKSKWAGTPVIKGYQGYSNQQQQLEKIAQFENEYDVKCIILWSLDKRSFSWSGILEQITEYSK